MADLSDSAALASQPLDHALALSARYYTDPRMPRLDAEAAFAPSWQLVCHQSQLSGTGDHLVTTIAGLPLLVVRSDEATIRAFHNVCRHRAGPVASCDGKGATALRGRYHGWTYGLDGVLRGAPEMGRTPDFDPTTIRLPEVRVRVWQGPVFVAGGDATPFDEFVAGIDARLEADRALGGFEFHHRASWDVACNWKVYVDNYLEGYHVPHIHPGLNSVLDYRSYVTETAEWYSFQFSPLDSGDDLYGSGEALYYFLYPNTMLNILPGRLQTNRVLPLGVAAAGSSSISTTHRRQRPRRWRDGEGHHLQRRSAGRGRDDLRGRTTRPRLRFLRSRPAEPAARERGAPLPRTAAARLPRGVHARNEHPRPAARSTVGAAARPDTAGRGAGWRVFGTVRETRSPQHAALRPAAQQRAGQRADRRPLQLQPGRAVHLRDPAVHRHHPW